MSDEYGAVKRGLDNANKEIKDLQHAEFTYKEEYIPRVWQDRKTGELVRVTDYQYVVGGGRRVIFAGVGWGFQQPLPRSEFEKLYKVYKDQHTTRI